MNAAIYLVQPVLVTLKPAAMVAQILQSTMTIYIIPAWIPVLLPKQPWNLLSKPVATKLAKLVPAVHHTAAEPAHLLFFCKSTVIPVSHSAIPINFPIPQPALTVTYLAEPAAAHYSINAFPAPMPPFIKPIITTHAYLLATLMNFPTPQTISASPATTTA
jgi:hypothetical protein